MSISDLKDKFNIRVLGLEPDEGIIFDGKNTIETVKKKFNYKIKLVKVDTLSDAINYLKNTKK